MKAFKRNSVPFNNKIKKLYERLGENHPIPETTNIPSGLKDASKVALLTTGFTL